MIFLRTCLGSAVFLRYTSPNLPRTHERDGNFHLLESTSLHLSANSSERRIPLVPASITITCSRSESSSNNAFNSDGVTQRPQV
jgi:hypothetical protein